MPTELEYERIHANMGRVRLAWGFVCDDGPRDAPSRLALSRHDEGRGNSSLGRSSCDVPYPSRSHRAPVRAGRAFWLHDGALMKSVRRPASRRTPAAPCTWPETCAHGDGSIATSARSRCSSPTCPPSPTPRHGPCVTSTSIGAAACAASVWRHTATSGSPRCRGERAPRRRRGGKEGQPRARGRGRGDGTSERRRRASNATSGRARTQRLLMMPSVSRVVTHLAEERPAERRRRPRRAVKSDARDRDARVLVWRWGAVGWWRRRWRRWRRWRRRPPVVRRAGRLSARARV